MQRSMIVDVDSISIFDYSIWKILFICLMISLNGIRLNIMVRHS